MSSFGSNSTSIFHQLNFGKIGLLSSIVLSILLLLGPFICTLYIFRNKWCKNAYCLFFKLIWHKIFCFDNLNKITRIKSTKQSNSPYDLKNYESIKLNCIQINQTKQNLCKFESKYIPCLSSIQTSKKNFKNLLNLFIK